MDSLKEYIVTAINYDVLDDLCDDIETPGGSFYVPARVVSVANKRPISRNTHYYLTDSEVTVLRNDPRVLAVELLPSALGMQLLSQWTQTGIFNKSLTVTSDDKNWGLLRVTSETNLSNWGENGSFLRTDPINVSTTITGKNVDVIMVDSHVNPAHPEFAVNVDGSGGSRINLFDWFSLSNIVGINTVGPYQYVLGAGNTGKSHGTHTAGIAVGNTHGWARDANIYNIHYAYPGNNFPVANWELYIFDYIRAFHENKPINPATGRRNPTITANSWGYVFGNISISNVTSVSYRGVVTAVEGTLAERKTILESNGIPVILNGQTIFLPPATYTALNADVQDAIDNGIIVISSAANSYWNIATPLSIDYNNYVVNGNTSVYGSQGSSPGNTPGAICVGATSTYIEEYKANFSNFGSRIDIYAPGENVISSVSDAAAASEWNIPLATDPRNANYYIGRRSGTSMACPQVAGYIACIAQEYPNFKNEDFLKYIIYYAKKNKIGTIGNSNQYPYLSLGDDSNNVYLYFHNERTNTGNTYPRQHRNIRPTTGIVFPRTKIRTAL